MSAPRRPRSRGTIRRPERDLEVVWQRHIFAGSESEADFDAAVGGLLDDVERELEQIDPQQFDDADLVVTISRRPL